MSQRDISRDEFVRAKGQDEESSQVDPCQRSKWVDLV